MTDKQPPMTSVLVNAPNPVLTLDEAKLRAGLDWTSPDPRDALMMDFVAAAANHVELDTALALLEQTRDVFVYGALPVEVVLPARSRPLRSVTSIAYVDADGAPQTGPVSAYAIDSVRGRSALVVGSGWPLNTAPFEQWTIRIVAGWQTPDLLPSALIQAIGLLVAHWATLGRDLASVETISELPYGYEDCVAAYRPVVCA